MLWGKPEAKAREGQKGEKMGREKGEEREEESPVLVKTPI